MIALRRTSLHRAAIAVMLGCLAGCATVDFDQALQEANQATRDLTQGTLELSRGDAQRQARLKASDQLLAQPLSMSDAVQLALANSPALQAMLAESWADLALASQRGRIANPLLTFERMRLGEELEIGRLLSFGLLDVLTLPQRQAVARIHGEQARTKLAANVVEHVGQVRQAWIRAVAAGQSVAYAQQVQRAAQASGELARQMQQVGNFTRLQRARQQSFYADATTRLALAQQAASGTREELVRQLGLDDAQAARLTLPERLPELPGVPLTAQQVGALGAAQRLDVQLARQQLAVADKAQALVVLGSLIDVDLGLRHDSVFDNAAPSKASRNGFEIDLRLPLFDPGDARRAAQSAQSLAALNRYEGVLRAALSQLRQSYSAYRTAFDIARHYRDEVLPLRKLMAEENLLRYNGMLIGVFELLADTRDQIASVIAAIDAQQQFWLADAALAASVLGKPTLSAMTPVAAGAATGAADPAH